MSDLANPRVDLEVDGGALPRAVAAPDAEAAAAPTRVLLVLGTAAKDGATVAALRLAEAALTEGHAVTVYAYGDAVRIGADGCPTGVYVRGLLAGPSGPSGRSALSTSGDDGVSRSRAARWIVDGADPRTTTQVAGVERGDGADLWRLLREADVVLGVTA